MMEVTGVTKFVRGGGEGGGGGKILADGRTDGSTEGSTRGPRGCCEPTLMHVYGN